MSTSRNHLEQAQIQLSESYLSPSSQRLMQQMTDLFSLSHDIIEQLTTPSPILAFICLLNLLLFVMLIVQLIRMLILLIILIILIRLLSLVFESFYADGA